MVNITPDRQRSRWKPWSVGAEDRALLRYFCCFEVSAISFFYGWFYLLGYLPALIEWTKQGVQPIDSASLVAWFIFIGMWCVAVFVHVEPKMVHLLTLPASTARLTLIRYAFLVIIFGVPSCFFAVLDVALHENLVTNAFETLRFPLWTFPLLTVTIACIGQSITDLLRVANRPRFALMLSGMVVLGVVIILSVTNMLWRGTLITIAGPLFVIAVSAACSFAAFSAYRSGTASPTILETAIALFTSGGRRQHPFQGPTHALTWMISRREGRVLFWWVIFICGVRLLTSLYPGLPDKTIGILIGTAFPTAQEVSVPSVTALVSGLWLSLILACTIASVVCTSLFCDPKHTRYVHAFPVRDIDIRRRCFGMLVPLTLLAAILCLLDLFVLRTPCATGTDRTTVDVFYNAFTVLVESWVDLWYGWIAYLFSPIIDCIAIFAAFWIYGDAAAHLMPSTYLERMDLGQPIVFALMIMVYWPRIRIMDRRTISIILGVYGVVAAFRWGLNPADYAPLHVLHWSDVLLAPMPLLGSAWVVDSKRTEDFEPTIRVFLSRLGYLMNTRIPSTGTKEE